MDSERARDNIVIGVVCGITLCGIVAGLIVGAPLLLLLVPSIIIVPFLVFAVWWTTHPHPHEHPLVVSVNNHLQKHVGEAGEDEKPKPRRTQRPPTLGGMLAMALILNLAAAMFLPHVHDFKNYLEGADRLLEGRQIYGDATQTGSVWFYGPLWAAVMALISSFSTNYVILKLPAVLANTLMLVPVYHLLRIYRRDAVSGTLYFMFSYIMLFNAMLGNDDSLMMLFLLCSIYLMVAGRYFDSALYYSIALGFKAVPLVLLPAMVWYMWRRGVAVHGYALSVFALLAGVILLFAMVGQDVTYPYLHPLPDYPVAQMSPLNFVRMTCAYFDNIMHYSLTKSIYPVDENPLKPTVDHPINELMNALRTPVLVAGYVLAFLYALTRRIADRERELLRNILLLLFIGFFFSRLLDPTYLLWAFPFMLLLTDVKSGASALYVFPLIAYGILYQWTPEMPLTYHILLHLSAMSVGVITYLSVSSHRKAWALAMCVFAFFNITEAVPRPYLYGIYYYIVAMLSVIMLASWLKHIHNIYSAELERPSHTLDEIVDESKPEKDITRIPAEDLRWTLVEFTAKRVQEGAEGDYKTLASRKKYPRTRGNKEEGHATVDGKKKYERRQSWQKG